MKKIFSLIFAILCILEAMTFSVYADDTTAVKNARNGVVYIEYHYSLLGEEIFQSGTGFFVGEKNKPVQYIVTNKHVVTGVDYFGDEIRNGQAYIYFSADKNDCVEAVVERYFEAADCAILKINTPTNKRTALTLMSAGKIDTTETIYALGFPAIANILNEDVKLTPEDVTVTTGSVTKSETVIESCKYIQIDASISPGNSGGPLVTKNGKVVGINTAGALDGSNTNVALYIDYVMDYLSERGIKYSKSESENTSDGESATYQIGVIIGIAVFLIIAYLKKRKKRGQSIKPNTQGPMVISFNPQHKGKTILINGTLVAGTDSRCAILYQDGTSGVANMHCTISYDATNQKFVLTDLGSLEGTFTRSGKRLEKKKPYLIDSGSRFYLGVPENMLQVELK